MAGKSFLVQRFSRLETGAMSIIGYSVAGEETVIQIPELDICFDIGRAPHFSLTSNLVCISHGHMDHLAGIAYYLSQRHFQGMQAGTVLLPRELHRPVDEMLRCWRSIERQNTPYTLIPMAAGDEHSVRKDLVIRALATHHAGISLGYSVVNVREKLKSEYLGLPGPELADMRKRGIEIQYKLEVPLVAFMGDTSIGPVFDHPDVINAEILLTECTFFERDHRTRAKVGKHLHLEQFVELLPRLRNKHIILTHVSRRTGIRKAKHLLRKRLGEIPENVQFLMDFEGAADAGDIESAGPAPSDAAE